MAGGMYNNSNAKYTSLSDITQIKDKKSKLVFISKGVEPPFPEEHEPFYAYFNFKNMGSVDAGEFKIRMVTESKENSSLGVDVEDQVVTSLKCESIGESILKFDYGMPTGRYVINAYLDYYNQIHRENEDMNNRQTSFIVIVG